MRAEQRRGELAVHAALGAGRARMVRQVLLEMLVLSAAAAALGTPLAWWGVRGLVAVLPAAVPRLDAVRLDAGVAAFIVGLPLVMTAIASLPAALLVGRGSIAVAVAHGGRRATTSARGRRVLVVAQVALAVAIVAAAGVLVRGLIAAADAGHRPAQDRLLFAELSLSGAAAERARHARGARRGGRARAGAARRRCGDADQRLALRRGLGRARRSRSRGRMRPPRRGIRP